MGSFYLRKLYRKLKALVTAHTMESIAGGAAPVLGAVVGGNSPEAAVGAALVIHGAHQELEVRARRWGRRLPSRPRSPDEYAAAVDDPARIGAMVGDVGAIQLGPVLQRLLTDETLREEHAVLDTPALNGSLSESLWSQVQDLQRNLDSRYPERKLDWVVVATGITDLVEGRTFDDDGLKKLVGMVSAGKHAHPTFRGAAVVLVLVPEVHRALGVPRHYRPIYEPAVAAYRVQQRQAILDFLPRGSDPEETMRTGQWKVGESDVVIVAADQVLSHLRTDFSKSKRHPRWKESAMSVEHDSGRGLCYTPAGLEALASTIRSELAPLVASRPANRRPLSKTTHLVLPADLSTEEFTALGKLTELDPGRLGRRSVPDGEPVGFPLSGRGWAVGDNLVIPSRLGAGPHDSRLGLPGGPPTHDTPGQSGRGRKRP